MKLFTALFHPETKLEVKEGIHVQEGNEEHAPFIEMGYPDGIGPYSRVMVDREPSDVGHRRRAPA